jgi:hypothetical protein
MRTRQARTTGGRGDVAGHPCGAAVRSTVGEGSPSNPGIGGVSCVDRVPLQRQQEEL